MQPTITELIIYPIKSLDGVSVDVAATRAGGIVGDRAFRIVRTEDKRQVNAKLEPKLISVRATYGALFSLFAEDGLTVISSVKLEAPGVKAYSGLLEENAEINEFFSRYLGYECELKGSFTEHHPDDPTNPGPSVVAKATLEAVSEHFQLPYDEITRRFRPNVIISGEGAERVFAEEKLIGRRFTFGAAVMEGVHVCRRCAVPTRHSFTGAGNKHFVKEFMEFRRRAGGIEVESIDGLYRLCIRTRLSNERNNAVADFVRPGLKLELLDE